MTDISPPPSPDALKHTENQDLPGTCSTPSSQSYPTLTSSAINRGLYYQFPSPPRSPRSPQILSSQPITSPRSKASSSRGPNGNRNTSRTASASSTHTRGRPSFPTVVEMEYGPPPHPAPTSPLPQIPGAPRVPFTTPAQERNRHSSYELCDKLRLLEKQQKENDAKNE